MNAAMARQFVGDKLGHFGIQWRQNLVQRFDKHDGNSSMTKILGDLKADEAATDHHSVSGSGVNGSAHSLNVLHRPKWQSSSNPGNRRDHRRGARTEHEFVKGQLV